MAGPDINELLRKVPLAKIGRWLQGNAEKVVFWLLVGSLGYTCFLVYQSYSSQTALVVEKGDDYETDEEETGLQVKPAALRGYKPPAYYEHAISRNPFINRDEKVDVPRPAEPKLVYLKLLGENKGQFRQDKSVSELSVGQAVGPWKLAKLEAETATFRTRYDHEWAVDRTKTQKAEVPPLAYPPKRRFQGKQLTEEGKEAAWLANPEEPTMESLVAVGALLKSKAEHKGKPVEYSWELAEVHEDRCILRLKQEHPDKKDVVWTYQEPEIPITYKGQSEVQGKEFGFFRVRVWVYNRRKRKWEVKTKSRYSEAGEPIKDTSFTLDTIAPDHVVVSRGKRKYTLRLEVEERAGETEVGEG